MNILPKNTARYCLLVGLMTCPLSVQAALPIDLEVATEAGAPVTAQQEWARLLGRMNLGSVRLGSARTGQRPSIEEKKLGNSSRYKVLAILNRRNELVLPEQKFRTNERRALQKYFEQLPARAAYNAEDRGRFGLTEKQFRRVYAELSQPVDFSTQGKTAREICLRFQKKIALPVERWSKVSARNSKPLSSELKGMSLGTALAYTLRSEQLSFHPEQLPSRPLRLIIEPYKPKQESWPVGWKPEGSPRKAAPHLYDLRNIEIDGFTLSQALTALKPALKSPVIMDDWIIAEQQIEPDKIQVSLTKQRTFLKSAVSKLLSQARLTEEVRVDELDQPFLWVTRFGKNSRPATD